MQSDLYPEYVRRKAWKLWSDSIESKKKIAIRVKRKISLWHATQNNSFFISNYKTNSIKFCFFELTSFIIPYLRQVTCICIMYVW